MLKKTVAIFLVWILAAYPTLTLAAPQIPGLYRPPAAPPPVNALPVVRGVVQGIATITQPTDSQLLIQQQLDPVTGGKAIIDWQSFNIGSKASVKFDQQKNQNWVILNRIYDKDPSQIFGTLTAEGKIYLINQNGILFGQGSQVNIYSLVASALNMKDSDFLGGTLKFQADSYINGADGKSLALDPAATVANMGTITTAGQLGSVFLLGPNVYNSGSITAPVGQIGLVAGTAVEFATDQTGYRTAYFMKMTGTPGTATNDTGGSLVADTGLVGMYGRDINQNGMIRSVTALKRNGQIELLATDSINLGEKSSTSTPISDSTETADSSFAFTGGKITLGGLDPVNPANPQTLVGKIDVKGSVEAPAGTVTMQAEQGIALESGSSVKVGGSWIDKPASTAAMDATLNSVTLADDFGQKNGVLHGTNITIDPAAGSSIGNVAGQMQVGEQTARERSVTGGTIQLLVASGDLIADKGATLDFSGGGVRYAAGFYSTSKLLCGTTVYDISTAQQWLAYSKLLGDQTTTTHNFGTTGNYVGLFFGGANAIGEYHSGYTDGADAGLLRVSAPHIVLDAVLNGSAVAGTYQTKRSTSDDTRALAIAEGIEVPRGGTLEVGDPWSNTASNLGVDSIVVKPSGDSGSSATLPPGTIPATVLSAAALSTAGLSSLSLNANTTITVESGAVISLNPGGSFSALARQIVNQGEIDAAGGSVTLRTNSNITSSATLADSKANPLYRKVSQTILLDSGSKIDVAGEKIDNSAAATRSGNPVASGPVAGGSVVLSDDMGLLPAEQGNGVVIRGGAVVDVSGGYQIGTGGKIAGGNSGSVQINGKGIVLDGTLVGLSLPGSNGGSISLHAGMVEVAASAPAPMGGTQITSDRAGKLTLGARQLDASGFSQVALQSEGDLVFDSNVQFSPSMAKAVVPVTATGDSTGQLSGNTFTAPQVAAGGSTPSPATVGVTSVTAVSGVLFPKPPNEQPPPNTTLTISDGAGIKVAPNGTVALQGDIVQMNGVIEAPAGKVAITANQGDLTIGHSSKGTTVTGKILAAGYDSPGTTAAASGLPVNSAPLAGGSVTLTAKAGSLVLDQSLIDVSGTKPVAVTQKNADGTVSTVSVGSDAGSISLTYGNKLSYGFMDGRSYGIGAQGGALTVGTTGSLSVTGDYLNWYAQCGFDALTLRSDTSLTLSKATNTIFGRSLTLDAPVIKGDGSAQTLAAPWITIQNTSAAVPAGTPDSGTSSLNLIGNWIDLRGAVLLSGFSGVSLQANSDIRASDAQYGSDKSWQGLLSTAGDLTLTANNIYPDTLTSFTIQSGGKVTTRPGSDPGAGTILSAGGSLTIDAAKGIEHDGVIRAPLGEISLNSPDGRVYLATGSVLSTAGTVPVAYGTLNDVFWTDQSRTMTNNGTETVAGAPEKSVSITAKEVITREGSTIDVSGGGSIFGYQFIPDVEGTTDPFAVKGRYVIMPDQSVTLPGNAIYLAGGNGIKAGYYSILPEQYAFLPGAMVVTDLGTIHTPGTNQVSPDGYPIVAGHGTVMGTSFGSPVLENYSIRTAADVMKEGNFSTKTFTAGEGGTVTLAGTTTIVNGDTKASGLPTYSGGVMVLSGTNVTVQQTGAALPAAFGFDSKVPAALAGTLQLAASAVTDKGLSELRLGDAGSTDTVTVQAGSVLNVPTLTLTARDAIDIGSGAAVNGGTVTFATPQGKITVEKDATVHVAKGMNIDADQMDLQGSITGNNGASLNLTATAMFFAADDSLAKNADKATAKTGLYFTEAAWQGFGSFSDVGLTSRSAITFAGDFNLTVAKQLTIDTGLIVGQDPVSGTTSPAASVAGTGSSAPAAGDTPAGTTLTAGTIVLRNSGAGPTATTLAGGNGAVTLAADTITVGQGSIQVSGFDQVNLASKNDLTFQGKGSLQVGKDLNMSAARVTTASAAPDGGAAPGTPSYVPANFSIAATGTVAIRGSGTGKAGTTETPGGSLAITAQGVDEGGVIDLPSGQLTITTGGSGSDNGIVLRNGASILARGSASPTADPATSGYSPGGTVILSAASAPITLEAGSLLDVSAAGTGDAGSITLRALQGGVTMEKQLDAKTGAVAATANLQGKAAAGKGGSLTVETDTMAADAAGSSFADLASRIAEGGFTGDIDLRARTGDVTVDRLQPAAVNTAAPPTVKAESFRLTADSGSITVNGTIDVSGTKQGGTVALFAGNNLVLAKDSVIDAHGGKGGEVVLGIDAKSAGAVDFQQGAVINVAGAGNTADTGGTVTFRAPQKKDGTNTYSDVALNLNGAVTGGSQVVAVGVRDYDRAGSVAIGDGDISGWEDDASGFMGSAKESSVKGTLALDKDTRFLLASGIEVRSTGDMTLAVPWDLSSFAPGEVTLRAGGNLTVAGSLTDNRNPANPSWGINLAAGADLTSADYLAAGNRAGNLTIADNTAVYTASAPLRFSSGGATTIRDPDPSANLTGVPGMGGVPFNLGTYSGKVTGRVGGDLVLFGGVIQSATGDIDVNVGGDLNLKTQSATMGSIRTTGAPAADPGQHWNYAGGGNIAVAVKGSVYGGLNPAEWDHINDVNGDGSNYAWSASYGQDGAFPTAGIVTMAGGDVTVRTGGNFSGQSGTFGKGNLSVAAGGDLGGHFLVHDGDGSLTAMGNIGNFGSTDHLVIDAFDAHLTLAARGDIELGTVLNPTVVREVRPGETIPWDLQYGRDASLSLAAATGDVTIYGTSQGNVFTSAAETVLPASLLVYAGNDINLQAQQLILAPSPTGNLQLRAGNDIRSTVTFNGQVNPSYLFMSDMDPARVYGVQPDFVASTLTTSHSAVPVHMDDSLPVVIDAGGNIADLQLHLPKSAWITAGGDIRDIYYSGENLHAGDISKIVAGGNILFRSVENSSSNGFTGIDQAGPGSLLVQAGDSIDLGTTKGIQSNGNVIDGAYVPALGNDGAAIMVVAGSKKDLDPDQIETFFTDLRNAGVEYSTLLSKGESQQAQKLIAQTRSDLIDTFFDGPVNDGTGNISMTTSQITTLAGKDDISIITRGRLDVGKTAFGQKTAGTGITTAAGGGINIFSGGDVNVNESRVMTFMGGDITVWSDQGNINAGRGSKTAISASPPKLVDMGDQKVLVFSPPAVGSGLRTLTFSPDGISAPPQTGDIYAFAPSGAIDAGEAGIAGNRLVLGATKVLNAQNISFTAGSVGVPASSEASVNVAAFSGMSALPENSKLIEQNSSLGSAQSKYSPTAGDMVDDFVTKFLDVKVINFDTDDDTK